jgi:hypothetical protein
MKKLPATLEPHWSFTRNGQARGNDNYVDSVITRPAGRIVILNSVADFQNGSPKSDGGDDQASDSIASLYSLIT